MEKIILNLINVILNNLLIIILATTIIITAFLFVAEISHFEYYNSSEASCGCGRDYSYFTFFIFYIPLIFYSIMFYLNYFLKNRYEVSIILYFLCSIITYALFFTIFHSLQKHDLILAIPFFVHIILNLALMNTSQFNSELVLKKFLALFYRKTKFFIKFLVYFLSSFTLFTMLYNFIQKFCTYFLKVKIIKMNDIFLQEKLFQETFLFYLLIYIIICNFIFSYFFQFQLKLKEIFITVLINFLFFTIISYTYILEKLIHFCYENKLSFFIIIFLLLI